MEKNKYKLIEPKILCIEVENLNKTLVFIVALILLSAYGCAPSSKTITFEKGVERINKLDEKFGATMKNSPNSTESINELLVQLTGFGAVNEDMPLPLKYLIDFRIKTLEAEKLHIEGWKWGKASTTDFGFGCKKGYPIITESARLRNSSAQKGYEAVNALQLLINDFPDEAESVNLTQKDVLFLNADYYQIERKASRDARIIENLCKDDYLEEINKTG